jgi:rRNA maturation endonuclease Nob1
MTPCPNRPANRAALLADLRRLLRTPEVARPLRIRCDGCGRHFARAEGHDCASCGKRLQQEKRAC